MKVGIVGNRDSGELDIDKIISYIPLNCSCIVSGGAKGVDSYARQAAQILGIPLQEYLPEYGKFAKAAPLERSRKIVENCDILLAFWDSKSSGTAHTISYCIKSGHPFRIIPLEYVLLNP